MRDVRSRSFYCSKIGKVVTLIECSRNPSGHHVISGIMHCSEQEGCIQLTESGERYYPRSNCPACLEHSDRRKPP